MAKKIRFPLEMKNGIEVRNIEEFREQFSLENVLGYLANGKLITWLKDRYLDEIADEISKLMPSDLAFNKKICNIFEVEYNEQLEVSLEQVAEKNRKKALLKKLSFEEKFNDVVDQIAFEQDDIYDLLDEGKTTIYLCGDKFFIPLSKKDIRYIGVNYPTIIIASKEKVDFDENGISFENIKFDEKYLQILANDTKVESMQNATNVFVPDSVNQVEKNTNSKLQEQMDYLVESMIECIDDYCEKLDENYCNDFICEFDGIREVDASDYGSDCYDYPTKAKAKVACKEAIESAIEDVLIEYKEEKENIIDSCNEFIYNIENEFKYFIVEFTESFDEYIAVYCTGEVEAYAKNKRNNEFNIDEMTKLFINQNLRVRFYDCTQELFNVPDAKLINVNEYFKMCTYDNDDENYCYEMDCAIDELNSCMDEFSSDNFNKITTITKDLCMLILNDYSTAIKNRLNMMLTVS